MVHYYTIYGSNTKHMGWMIEGIEYRVSFKSFWVSCEMLTTFNLTKEKPIRGHVSIISNARCAEERGHQNQTSINVIES